MRLANPADHSRSILFLKNDYWVVRDRIESRGEPQADLWFHFEAGSSPVINAVEGQAVKLTEGDEKNGLDITGFGENIRWRREAGWVSQCYGSKEQGRVYVLSAAVASGQLVTFLLPQSMSAGRQSQGREVEAIGGRAFEVTHEQGFDILMLRDLKATRVETERLAADFEWTWARFASRTQTTPNELVLINGQMLELEGREILKSTKKIQFLVTRQSGEQLSLETEAGMLDLNLPVHDLKSVFAELIRQSGI